MSNSLRDKVLDAIDIVQVIGERVRLDRKGKEYVGLCPFHPDHKPSLSVSPAKRIFKCWSCGAGGDAVNFVQKIERVQYREALASLARRAGIETQSSSPADQRAEQLRRDLRAVIDWARQHFQRNLQATVGGRRAYDYALSRGLTPQTVERVGLGYAADAWDDLLGAARRAGFKVEQLQQAGLAATSESGKTYDRFRNRLIFPISDALGRTVAFGGRTLADDPAKYLNSPETALFSKSRVLYGLDRARRAIEAQRVVLVVEGYMDAVLLAQFGFEHTVATLGTALTEAHIKLLQPLTDRVYLCFDNDQAGQRAADRAAELALRMRAQVLVAMLEGGKDPADCLTRSGAEGFRAELNRAVDALEFKWSQTLRAFGVRDGRGRRAAIEEFVRFAGAAAAAGSMDPLEQNLLVGRLSELLSVPAEEVFTLLARARRSGRPATTVGSAAGAPVSETSAYEASIKGLPAGLVTAAETVLGLLAVSAACWPWADASLQLHLQHSETWRRLFELLLDLRQNGRHYSVGDVSARCEDSATCELVGRAVARVAGCAASAESFGAAAARLASESAVLRMNELREGLRQKAGDGPGAEALFGSLREAARTQHSVLPAESRRSAAAL